MTDKKLGLIGIVIVAFAIWFLAEKANAAQQITPRIIGIKPKGNINLSNLSAVPVTAEVALNNYGKANVNVNQIYLEVYNQDGSKLIAQQTAPLPQTVRVTANSSITISVPFTISVANITNFLFAGNAAQATLDLAKFALGGKLNKKIMLKGFVRGEGIKVNINTTVEL